MAVDWAEVGSVAAGALLAAFIRRQIAPPTAPTTTAPAPRPSSCVRMPRFIRQNGECFNVVDNIAMQDFWCDAQDSAPGDDDFYWPWSHPECKR
jgi:hypothetical protein